MNYANRIKQRFSFIFSRGDMLLTLGRQGLAAILQLSIVVIIARQLGPAGNGIYSIALLLPTLAGTFLNLGVAPATVFYVSRGDMTMREALRTNLCFAALASLGGLIILLPLILIFGDVLFPGIPLQLLWLSLAGFPLALITQLLNSIIQAKEDFRSFNLVLLAPPTFSLLCILCVIYFLNGSISTYILAYLGGQVAGVFTVIYSLSLHLRKEPKTIDSSYKLRSSMSQLLRYGWKAQFANVLAYINYRADIFLVNFFTSPATTGLYVIAVQFAEKLWMLSQAVSAVLLPRFTKMHESTAERNSLSRRYAVAIMGITLLASILLVGFLHVFVDALFGPAYHQVITPFILLLPGIVAGAASRILANCIAAAGKPEWNLLASILVVSINITGNCLLIPHYGIAGAAVATSIAYTVNALIKWSLIYKLP